MSNLLKGFNVARGNDDKRVIDCNAIISEMLVKMKKTVDNDEFTENGFNPLLNPLNVSEVLSDEEHIIGETGNAEKEEAFSERFKI